MKDRKRRGGWREERKGKKRKRSQSFGNSSAMLLEHPLEARER
jgi:hypothetical protein